MSFFCMHLFCSITRKDMLTTRHCYHLCRCLTTPGGACTKLPCRVLLMGRGVAHQETGGEGRIEEHQPLFLFISATSHPARAGWQTCKSLTWQLRPLQPTLALLTSRTQQSPRWRSRSHRWVWSWLSSAFPALLHKCRCALGHKNSHYQLVWKSTANFFWGKHERTEEKLPFSKFTTQQNLGEFFMEKENAFP